ncbi:hypothetical protein CORC01_05778 [Colletotrichum orchidophilum]|uniref:Uncharacterized protein n=1 Tax=Colletotrichum orchidophilum TaxID=1209926 RepID=A0A1G4BC47_9PEZI|nr:uncharacterized protein CORC01_05778 [Colletotrichum orchidophilum]OHE98882.1 hypothetical protein CORC01_05778 [Colletotrichum orchidophilum]
MGWDPYLISPMFPYLTPPFPNPPLAAWWGSMSQSELIEHGGNTTPHRAMSSSVTSRPGRLHGALVTSYEAQWHESIPVLVMRSGPSWHIFGGAFDVEKAMNYDKTFEGGGLSRLATAYIGTKKASCDITLKSVFILVATVGSLILTQSQARASDPVSSFLDGPTRSDQRSPARYKINGFFVRRRRHPVASRYNKEATLPPRLQLTSLFSGLVISS